MAKSPYDMTIAELQTEISRLQAALYIKIAGEPWRHVTGFSRTQNQTGCICPAGAEVNCQGLNCPRRFYGDLKAS